MIIVEIHDELMKLAKQHKELSELSDEWMVQYKNTCMWYAYVNAAKIVTDKVRERSK